MRSVGIKVLKNNLSEYVRVAAAGEVVLVTDRDRVVAELVAPRAERSPFAADALLADAVRRGWLTPPLRKGGEVPPRTPVAPWADLAVELDSDREDR
jgi:antitoxin (DNA-binding transcriptional repressor) of toxin-antitoxin stability system